MALTVNGEIIDQKAIDEEVERLRPDYDRYVRENNADGGDDQLVEWSRENVIERTLIRQAAKESGPVIPKKELEEAWESAKDRLKGMKKKQAVAEMELQMKTEQLLKSVSGAPEPTEQEIKLYYGDNKDVFVAPEQVAVRHIEKKFTTPEEKTAVYVELLNIKEQINNGAVFEDLAAEHSDCSGFDIGYFGRGKMVQDFEDIVFNMDVGKVSDVFLTQFGYHIAKVYDRKPGGPVPLKEVEDHIKAKLAEEKGQKAVEDFIDGLKSKASIENG